MISKEFDDDLPPPAYTEQEYDNKVSLARQASLVVNHSQDEWEEWDEAKFEAAAAANVGNTTSASSSSGPRQYNDVKKPVSSYPQEKQGTAPGAPSGVSGPSTSQMGNHGPSSSLPTGQSPGSIAMHASAGEGSSSQSYQPATLPIGDIHYGDDEDTLGPPPAFTGVGPSLDGPPYEEVVRLSYNPHDEGHSTPRLPSPSWSTPRDDLIPRPSSAATSIHSYYPTEEPQSLVEQQRRPVEQSRHVYLSPHSYQTPLAPQAQAAVPRMGFNPSVAYGRVTSNEPDLYRKAAPVVDASAFYNSSVSAYMGSGNAHSSRPVSQHFSSSNPNIHGSHPLPDTNRFSRNSTAFTSSPISPMPKYPPGQRTAFDTAQYSQYPTYAPTYTGNGVQDNRWSTADRNYPFSR
ncbi:hypothetical protein PM082_005497 [Marasmius tenuissimus]|nr:hypothetical protein PM082_005497 [Marasmius tenuissimus]